MTQCKTRGITNAQILEHCPSYTSDFHNHLYLEPQQKCWDSNCYQPNTYRGVHRSVREGAQVMNIEVRVPTDRGYCEISLMVADHAAIETMVRSFVLSKFKKDCCEFWLVAEDADEF